MMHPEVTEHVCEAQHCVTCCPVRKAYDDGFEDAKDIYRTPLHRYPTPDARLLGMLLVLVAVTVLWVMLRRGDGSLAAV